MTAETPILETSYHIPEVELLEAFLLAAIKEHDGFCLDNEPERVRLASALTSALLAPVDDRVINLSLLLADPALEALPQTTGSSVSTLPAE
jgi:hypothetical protein